MERGTSSYPSIKHSSKNEHFLICVSNVGNELATNVKLRFNDFFKEYLFAKQLRESFSEIEDIPFVVPAHDSKYFYLMPTLGFGSVSYSSTHETITGDEFEKWLEEHREDHLDIYCTYTAQIANDSYNLHFSTFLKHCFGHAAEVIDNEVDAIIETNRTLQRIEKLIKKTNNIR